MIYQQSIESALCPSREPYRDAKPTKVQTQEGNPRPLLLCPRARAYQRNG